MASLVLGAVGGYLFGPIGFALGSALGSLLFPEKMEGPRLQDKHLTGSSYGEPIPILYGTIRTAGQVIWTTDLQEHEHETGGKGGPQVTTYTYSASFSVLLCESPAIGVSRLWADGTLIYDTIGTSGVDNSLIPVTFYMGEADQGPDPTEEAVLGADNVPAYRHVVRMVFEDWDLGTWGNRLPQLTAEVFANAGVYPWRVSEFSPWATPLSTYAAQSATYADGVITVSWTNKVSDLQYYWAQWDLQGNEVMPTYLHTEIGYRTLVSLVGSNSIAGINASSGIIAYWFNPNTEGVLIRGIGDLGPEVFVDPTKLLGFSPLFKNDQVYCVGGVDVGVTVIVRRPSPLTAASGAVTSSISLDATYAASTVCLGTSDTEHIYVCVRDVGLSGTKLWKFTSDLQLDQFWDVGATAGTYLDVSSSAGGQFHVHNNNIIFNYRPNVGPKYIAMVKINGSSLTNTGTLLEHTDWPVYSLGGCLLLDADGVFSVCPPPAPAILGEIVADIGTRSGLVSSQQPDLPGSLPDLVPGFMISRQSTGRDNIMQLRSGYFFDGVESSAAMKFVKRGGASIVTIPQAALAAQQGDSGSPPPLLTVKRGQEVDLPATVYVVHFDSTADYQTGTQYARRLVTQSEANARVDLAIAWPPITAAAVANKLLFQAWCERTGLSALTYFGYLWYEPTDVITANGYTFRVGDKRVTASRIVQLDGVQTAGSIYVAQPSAAPGMGYNPPVLVPKAPTELLLMDVPLAVDSDDDNGAYAGMASATGTGRWPGASLYKSTDGGSAYSQVGSLSTPTVMGTMDTLLAPFYGGNVVDEINYFDVTIGPGGGTLVGVDLMTFLGGANLALIGLEFVQYMRVELLAPNQYRCGSLLRGRRGTEWAMQGHNVGERFVVYPFLNFPILPSELSLPRDYKGVTLAMPPALVDSQEFTSYGEALRPYAPVQLGGGINAGDDAILAWTRRTRKGGAWSDFTDVPLAEPTEQFVVQIWNSTYTLVARIIMVSNAQTTTYTAAQQVTDFGAEQETIYWTVGQVGVYTLGTQARAATPGGGATVDEPLNPVPPYNGSPIPPSGGGAVDVTLSYPTDLEQVPSVLIGDTFVAKFTVGGSPPTGGYVSVAEYTGTPYMRHLRLCTDLAGTTLVPNGEIWGNPASLSFGSGSGQCNLSASTDYYLYITMQLPNGDPSGVPGTSVNLGITLNAV